MSGRLLSILALAVVAALVAKLLLVPPMKSAISSAPNVPKETGEAARVAPPSEPGRTDAPGKK